MHPKSPLSPFTLIAAFIALTIIGLAVTPLLNMKLFPGRVKPSITVSYQMRGANAVVVDSEVTSRFEGIFSRISGLQKLRSNTGNGYGRISLEMDKCADMDVVRFEVSTLIRQVYPSLPAAVSYPVIRVNRPDEEEDKVETLITFTFNGPGSRNEIGAYAEEVIKPLFADIDGVHSVGVYGSTPFRIDLEYRREALDNIGLTTQEMVSQVNDYYRKSNLGRVYEESYTGDETYIPVTFTGWEADSFDPEQIYIKKHDRLFKLSELVEVKHREELPRSYYRINGLNTININVLATKSANQIVAAGLVKEKANELRHKLLQGYSLNISYDSSVFLKDELSKIVLRILASLVILLLFVLLVSRSGRYLLVITFSILANILIAFIFYYWLGIEIHMYSLAGITISLGIIIDNTIVMADHLRNGKGIGVFRAILAATLTTMGALVSVFFLDEDLQLKLLDFAWVIIINLGVSLLVSLFFIPALQDKLPLTKRKTKRTFKRARRKVKLTNFYGRAILLMARFRWALLLIAILGFGLPVFLMPAYLNGDKWYCKLYNDSFGSQLYTEDIKPVSDIVLGGTLRLFTEKVKHGSLNSSTRRTKLNISGTMNDGTTLVRTNEVFGKLENFLTQFEEIDQFQTRIYSPSSARLEILFKPEHEFTGFPHTLKSEVEGKVIELGAADWTVSGVGRGFDNSLHEGHRNSRMMLYGYNLETLKGYAEKVKSYLEEIQRVEKKSIFINGRASRGDNIHREYYLDMDLDKMRRTGISRGRILNELSEASRKEERVMSIYERGNRQNLYLTPEEATVPDLWGFYNKPLDVGNEKTAKLSGFSNFRKEREQDLINKEDMEYTMVVEFNFIGSYGQKKYIIGQVEQRIMQELPIGYRIKQQYYEGGSWRNKNDDNSNIWLIFLVAVIIFFICAIVFESLLQPLAVLMMIPLSFIGVFLTFYLFELGFDQGGYASLLLLSGLTVNSALYILNDLNNVRRKHPGLSQLRMYLKAYNQKLIPVLLTLLSTVLGLVPFLSGGKKEAFWFSMAAGTIGGLIFSLLAIVIILPMFVKGVRSEKRKVISEKLKRKSEQEKVDVKLEEVLIK